MGDTNIGFIGDRRRINVALTRAQYGLITIGDPEVLRSNATWKRLSDYFRSVRAEIRDTDLDDVLIPLPPRPVQETAFDDGRPNAPAHSDEHWETERPISQTPRNADRQKELKIIYLLWTFGILVMVGFLTFYART
jgi:hypothetical protein